MTKSMPIHTSSFKLFSISNTNKQFPHDHTPSINKHLTNKPLTSYSINKTIIRPSTSQSSISQPPLAQDNWLYNEFKSTCSLKNFYQQNSKPSEQLITILKKCQLHSSKPNKELSKEERLHDIAVLELVKMEIGNWQEKRKASERYNAVGLLLKKVEKLQKDRIKEDEKACSDGLIKENMSETDWENYAKNSKYVNPLFNPNLDLKTYLPKNLNDDFKNAKETAKKYYDENIGKHLISNEDRANHTAIINFKRSDISFRDDQSLYVNFIVMCNLPEFYHLNNILQKAKLNWTTRQKTTKHEGNEKFAKMNEEDKKIILNVQAEIDKWLEKNKRTKGELDKDVIAVKNFRNELDQLMKRIFPPSLYDNFIKKGHTLPDLPENRLLIKKLQETKLTETTSNAAKFFSTKHGANYVNLLNVKIVIDKWLQENNYRNINSRAHVNAVIDFREELEKLTPAVPKSSFQVPGQRQEQVLRMR